jgi:serine/threonine-protein kinase
VQPAVQRLEQAGFKASIAYVPSDQPFGTVVAQSPSSGASATAGSQVTVNVSTGRGRNPIETVPNVVGTRIAEALPALHAVGLRLIVLKTPVEDKSQAGVIALQATAAGKQAPRNAQVLVYYGAYDGWSRYQPRVSSSSLGSSDCDEIPTIGSPRPAETRASTVASM